MLASPPRREPSNRSRLDEALDSHDVAYTGLLKLACFLVGVTTPLSQLTIIRVGGISATLLLAIVVATLGWWRGLHARPSLLFVGFSTLFAVATLISGYIAGGPAMSGSITISLWFFFIIPGLSVVFSDKSTRNAALAGLLAGATFYLLIVLSRVATGQAPVDPESVQYKRQLLGLNRRVVDHAIVSVIPLVLLRRALPVPQWYTVSYLAAATLWIAASRSRTGLICLVVAPLLVWVLGMRPSPNGLPRRLLVLLAIVGVLYLGLAKVSIPGFGATDRIQAAAGGDRDTSDDLRVLLAKKAWAIGTSHPLTGVGWDNVTAAYHPVVEEAENPRVRLRALGTHPHNSYLETFANVGLFGLFGWAGALFVPVVLGARRANHPEIRALTASMGVVLIFMLFHGGHGVPQFVTSAVALGALADPVLQKLGPTAGRELEQA